MTEKLKLNIINIIKKEQLKVVDILEASYKKKGYIDYEKELKKADLATKNLIKQIKEKSQYFTKVVNSEDELLKLFENFFDKITPLIDEILHYYKLYKNSRTDDVVTKNLSILIIKDILNDYIRFLVKLEGAVLGLYSKNVILNIDLKEQIEMVEFLQNEPNKSIFMPLLFSFGIGYFIGDM